MAKKQNAKKVQPQPQPMDAPPPVAGGDGPKPPKSTPL